MKSVQTTPVVTIVRCMLFLYGFKRRNHVLTACRRSMQSILLSPDYTSSTTSANLFVLTSDGVEHRRFSASSMTPKLDEVSANSKRHLRRHFAKSRSRITDEQSSASFDWSVTYSLYIT